MTFSIHNPKRLLQSLKWVGYSLLTFWITMFLLNALFPFPLKEDYSKIFYDTNGEILHTTLSRTQAWRFHVQVQEVDKSLIRLLLWKEDKWFYYHYGFNPIAMFRAALQNIFSGKRQSGASTITMQLVRMHTRYPRTYFYKIIEVFRAIQLEWQYSKDEILTFYINRLPYGGNIEGVYAASWWYFHKKPKDLTLSECVVLAIIPNRPRSLNIQQVRSHYLHQEKNRWLKRYYEAGHISKAEYEEAYKEEVQLQRKARESYALHFCNELMEKYPERTEYATTLDIRKQLLCERILAGYMPRLWEKGVQNAAVMVVNNRTHSIEAYIGSPDFRDSLIAGQVDGVQAVRSPGSTLKPLIYGLSFDKGWVTPKRILLDVPMQIASYAPQNYDEQFRGKVTTEFALANSLNIPAVWLMKAYGQKSLIDLLVRLRFHSIERQREELGLSLILGGCGVRLYELVQLYGAFANRGIWHSLKALQGEPQDSFQLISAEAAYFLYSVLTQLNRPDFPRGYEQTAHLAEVAWKTGTSFGWRDGWAIGFSANYTIGVWTGNHDGTGSPFLSGSHCATPLLFLLFQALEEESRSIYSRPQSFRERWVCVETGLPPNTFCQNLVKDEYVPLVSSAERCNHMREVYVDALERVSYCAACRKPGSIKKAYPNLPNALVRFYMEKNIHFERIPPHDVACKANKQSSEGLKIVLPQEGAEYWLHKGQGLPLSCEFAIDSERLSWFVNGLFWGSFHPSEPIGYKPERSGTYEFVVVDNQNRRAMVTVKVHLY